MQSMRPPGQLDQDTETLLYALLKCIKLTMKMNRHSQSQFLVFGSDVEGNSFNYLQGAKIASGAKVERLDSVIWAFFQPPGLPFGANQPYHNPGHRCPSSLFNAEPPALKSSKLETALKV